MGFEFASSVGESLMAGKVKVGLDTRELDKIVKGLDKNIDPPNIYPAKLNVTQ